MKLYFLTKFTITITGGRRKITDKSSNSLPTAGHFQSAAGHDAKHIRRFAVHQNERPNAGGVPRGTRKVHHCTAQSDQQQINESRRREEGDGQEGGEERREKGGGEEGREGEG